MDEVPCYLFKHCDNIITKPLTLIINKSMSTGVFPTKIKASKVIPTHKKNEKKLVNNYRPVAVQSAFSKVLEMVYINRLTNYLDNSNLITNSQFGFRKG